MVLIFRLALDLDLDFEGFKKGKQLQRKSGVIEDGKPKLHKPDCYFFFLKVQKTIDQRLLFL
jgi:hypothetical protein